MTERRLTEAEWRRLQAQDDCRTYGHDWRIVEDMSGPAALLCERDCGAPMYAVVRDDETAVRP